ncbi:MAG: hypothetical protein Q9195_008405 [Heterodermia aff. obscurata]
MSEQTPVDNTDHSGLLLGGSIVLIAVASTAVTMRLVARRMKRLSWEADDYLIVVALTFAYAMFIALLFCIQNGLGKHVHGPDLAYVGDAEKALYVFEDIFPICTAATKISILCLYKRIFTTRNRTFAYALYVVGGLQIAWAIAGFFTTIFQCLPINALWLPAEGIMPKGKPRCIKLIPALLGLASTNTMLIAAVLILPIPMVWSLQMPIKQKVAICGIFVLGCADLVAAIVRCVLTGRVVTPTSVLWAEASAVMLSFAEPCVGILCACLPVMRPLLVAMSGPVSRIWSKSSRSPFSSRGPKASHSTGSSAPTEHYGSQSRPEAIRAGISARMPVGEGPLFTNRVYGGAGSQWPLMDEEAAVGGMKVKPDLLQSGIKR